MTSTFGRLLRDIPTARAWEHRIQRDIESASRAIPDRLQSLHAAVIGRAIEGAAHSLILSGSTARASRTEISDLDYHLVGDNSYERPLGGAGPPCALAGEPQGKYPRRRRLRSVVDPVWASIV